MAKIMLGAVLDKPARAADSTVPVFAVRLLRVNPDHFDRLYGEIASFMQGPGSKIRGCSGATLFGNEEKSNILIVAEFRSRRHWCRAQWDERLGDLLEEIVTNAETLHFSLYTGDCFSSAPARPVPAMSTKLEA